MIGEREQWRCSDYNSFLAVVSFHVEGNNNWILSLFQMLSQNTHCLSKLFGCNLRSIVSPFHYYRLEKIGVEGTIHRSPDSQLWVHSRPDGWPQRWFHHLWKLCNLGPLAVGAVSIIINHRDHKRIIYYINFPSPNLAFVFVLSLLNNGPSGNICLSTKFGLLLPGKVFIERNPSIASAPMNSISQQRTFAQIGKAS